MSLKEDLAKVLLNYSEVDELIDILGDKHLKDITILMMEDNVYLFRDHDETRKALCHPFGNMKKFASAVTLNRHDLIIKSRHSHSGGRLLYKFELESASGEYDGSVG